MLWPRQVITRGTRNGGIGSFFPAGKSYQIGTDHKVAD
jgi:hypothetical protein